MDTKDIDRFRLRFMNNHMKLNESEVAHNRRKGNSVLKTKHYIDLLWESEYGGVPSEDSQQESQSRPASSIQYCTQSFVP